jgi:hypothetical protein
MKRGRRRRATMAEGGCSPKGAVDGGGGFTSDSGGVPPTVGHGQEARGWGWGEVVFVACLRRRKREEKEGVRRCQ